MNKNNGVVLAVFVSLSGAAQGGTYIADEYIGADSYGPNNSTVKDVIGAPGDFAISGMDVGFDGTLLKVRIDTAFAGKGDEGLFTSSTDPAKGIGYGDLFLAGDWDPEGDADDKYKDDDADNGTLWTYGFSLDDRWMSETENGTGTLYRLLGTSNDDNALLSDDFIVDNSGYRWGQEVAVDTTKTPSTVEALSNSGSWWIESGSINFQIDLAGTGLLGPNASEIALHWALTCANDVIEGAVQIPQGSLETPIPAAAWLFGTAIAGFFGFTRRKKAAV
jgi:hypothetical protein